MTARDGVGLEQAMATTEDKLVIRQLESARNHLLARGDADAVKSLDAIIDRLGEPEPALEPAPKPEAATDELITAQEAARLLGVNSVSPVWTWVGQGRLAFRTVNGSHRITRDSVEKLLDDPVVKTQRKYEAELAEAFAPFEATDEDLAEIYDWWPVTKNGGD
jgi:hypothetical protein